MEAEPLGGHWSTILHPVGGANNIALFIHCVVSVMNLGGFQKEKAAMISLDA